MTPDFWKVIGGIVSLIVLVVGFLIKRSDEKKKAVADVDKEIDAIDNADDVTRMGDRLRLK